jgi:hypothetical protein
MPIPLDPEVIDEMDEFDDDDQPEDEYGPSLPTNPSKLHADGDLYDLKDPDQVIDLVEHLKDKRQDLNDSQLSKYEGRSTDWGGGGRSRLLYDQVRAKLAQEHHEGRHNMSWQDQHAEGMKVVKIVAIKNQTRF